MDTLGTFQSPIDGEDLVAPVGFRPQERDDSLELSAEELREAFRIARLAVWHWVVGTEEFRWSAQLFRITGRDPRRFRPTLENSMAHIHPHDREEAVALLKDAAASGVAHGHEFRICHVDGSIRHCWARIKPVAEDDAVVAVRGVLFDITDRRRAEAALEESNEHYRTSLELNPQIPWTAGPDGRIIEAGARWTEAVEAPPAQWHLALHEDDRPATLAAWGHSLATGEPVDLRYRLRLRDGSWRWFRARAVARRDSEGAIRRWYGLLEDIDQQVHAEFAAQNRDAWLFSAHEAAGLGLFDIDLSSGSAKLSPTSLLLHGLPADADPLLHCWEDWGRLIHPEDAERGAALVRESIATGAPYDFTFRVPLAGGDYRFINGIGRVEYDAHGQPLRLIGINLDVTARRTAERRLRATEATNRAVVDSSPDGIKLLSADGIVLFANGGSATGMDLPAPDALVGKFWLNLWPAAARPRVEQSFAAALAGRPGRFSAARATHNGTPKWWDVVLSPVIGEDGRVDRIVAVSRDITQQKQAEEKFLWSATHDPLTHLPNRRLFEERLAAAIEEAEVTGTLVGLLAIDLDNLKLINDTLGHDAGNAALRKLGDRLIETIGRDATAARLGGDEFAVVLPHLHDPAEAGAVAQRILARLRDPFTHEGKTLDCRASIGASLYPCDGASGPELLKQADLALYASKARRGGVQMFEPRMRADLQQRVSMVNIARDALLDDRLCAFFQPKVHLANGALAGFEALTRWQDHRGNIHLPATIAAAFEDNDLATAITDRIVDLSIAAMRGWIDAGIDFRHVAINASAVDFRQRDFAGWLLGRLDTAGIDPSFLQLEVTETVFLGRGADFVEDALKKLSARGVTIALDDFGTGYASLSHLKQFPVDIIKIDQSFVADIQDDCGDAAIVEAIVNLGRAMKIAVVAEGIETPLQARRLRRLGCRYGQGFLFGSAVPAADVPRIVRGRRRKSAGRAAPKSPAPAPAS